MEKLLPLIRSNIKFKIPNKFYTIDNLVFKLHYRFTTPMLFLMSLMITSQELIGEHIKCIGTLGINSGSAEEQTAIINRYCYFTSTFTLPKYMNSTSLDRGDILHPGVGAMGPLDQEDVKYHAYYQWVPYVLFCQAILFCVPHLIWKKLEGQRMQNLVYGLEYAAYSTEGMERPVKIAGNTIPTVKEINSKLEIIKDYFKDSLIVNQFWTLVLISCEILNLANIILNIFFTDAFLDGQFLSLGPRLVHDGLESSVDPLDVIFPKVTKCTYFKYGPSGSLLPMDSICVMALNIFNEKAYTVLWFWFMFVLAMSCMIILWRLISLCLYSRSVRFNEWVFHWTSAGPINVWNIMLETYDYDYMTWTFLLYLAENMKNALFMKFLDCLLKEKKQMPLTQMALRDSEAFIEKEKLLSDDLLFGGLGGIDNLIKNTPVDNNESGVTSNDKDLKISKMLLGEDKVDLLLSKKKQEKRILNQLQDENVAHQVEPSSAPIEMMKEAFDEYFQYL